MASPVATLVDYLTNEVMESPAALPDHMPAILDVLQSQHVLSSPQMTLDMHKQWNQRLMAVVRNKHTPVRCCGLALVEITLTATPPLGSDPELLNSWSIELPDIFRRAISAAELEAATAAMHAVTTAVLRNAEARRELLTVHLPKLMAGLQSRLEGEGARVQPIVVDHVALLLRALRASARPYLAKLDTVTQRLLLHTDQSVRDAAVHVLVTSTLCTVDDSWSPLAARAMLSLELQLDALAVPEEEANERNTEKQKRQQQAGSAFFSDTPTTDAKTVLQRAETCVRLMRSLLESTEAGAVNFPLRDALSIIGRVLNWRIASTDGSDLLSLATVVPRSQAIALRLLKLLMRRMGDKLYRDAEVLFTLLVRLLAPAVNLGCPAYLLHAVMSTLQEYLSTFSAAAAHFIGPLASALRDQLNPARVETGPVPGTAAQRKRKKKATAQEVATSTALRAQEAEKLYSHVELLVARLKTLHSLLLHAGSALSKKHRVELDQVILALLTRLVAERSLLPYSFPAFRFQLYSVLYASLVTPLDCQSPLLPYAMHFFTAGQLDSARYIAEFCVQGAALCAARVNPRATVDSSTPATPAAAPVQLFSPFVAPLVPAVPALSPAVPALLTPVANADANPSRSAPTPLTVNAAIPAAAASLTPAPSVGISAPPSPAPTASTQPAVPMQIAAPTQPATAQSSFQLPMHEVLRDAEDSDMAEIVDRSPDDSSADQTDQ